MRIAIPLRTYTDDRGRTTLRFCADGQPLLDVLPEERPNGVALLVLSLPGGVRAEIPMRTRRDKNNRRFLFGSIRPLNLVAFVYVSGEGGDEEDPVLVLRDYQDEQQRRADKNSEFDQPWEKAG